MENKLVIVKNECPYCNEVSYTNKRVFANHIRWCKKNPKYEEIRQGTIDKLKESSSKNSTKKDRIVCCVVCGKSYTVSVSDSIFNKGEYRKTCSNFCAKELTAKNTNKTEKNKKIATKIVEYINEHKELGAIKLKSETCNENHIFERQCVYCNKIFTTIKKKQKFCSPKCSRDYRRIFEISNKEEKDIYRSQTKFKFGLRSFPDEFEFSLIEESGWYKATNHGDNLKGISRDHMFSVDEGYKQGIDPYYISHPANCKLMKHEDNFKKLNGCSITKGELFERVKDWNEKYGFYDNKIDYTKIERFQDVK